MPAPEPELGKVTTPSLGYADWAPPVERWLPIPGYEGRYEVSDRGRIHSIPRRYTKGGILSTPPSTHGYLVVDVGGSVRNVHRLVALAFLGPCPPGQEVRHLDGDKTNNHLPNLTYGTPQENGQDQLRHGTHHHANQTHCLRGHPYNEANTSFLGPGYRKRVCRVCRRERRQQREAVAGT